MSRAARVGRAYVIFLRQLDSLEARGWTTRWHRLRAIGEAKMIKYDRLFKELRQRD